MGLVGPLHFLNRVLFCISADTKDYTTAFIIFGVVVGVLVVLGIITVICICKKMRGKFNEVKGSVVS